MGTRFHLPVTDIHIHIQPWEMLRPEVRRVLAETRHDGDRIEKMMRDPAALLEYLDEQGVGRVGIINYESPDVMGFTRETNAFASRYARHASDRIVPFGSIHPRFSTDIDGDLSWLLDELGIRGIKIHPSHQLLYPNDYGPRGVPGLARIYERASERRLPVMFHTGTSIFPGARNKYADPIHVEDVAIDFPELTILLAHGGRPLWMETAFFLLRRFPRMYLDISGIPPRRLLEYFPRLDQIAERTLFGTDWPSPGVRTIGENLDQFLALPLPDAAKEAILSRTADRIFGPIRGD